MSDGNGLPLRINLTEGKTHDSVPALNLLKSLITNYLIADKAYAYDSLKIINFIENQGVESVMPSRKTNLIYRNYDKNKYKKKKHYRTIF